MSASSLKAAVIYIMDISVYLQLSLGNTQKSKYICIYIDIVEVKHIDTKKSNIRNTQGLKDKTIT